MAHRNAGAPSIRNGIVWSVGSPRATRSFGKAVATAVASVAPSRRPEGAPACDARFRRNRSRSASRSGIAMDGRPGGEGGEMMLHGADLVQQRERVHRTEQCTQLQAAAVVSRGVGRALQPVAKVGDSGSTKSVEFRTLESRGDGQETGGSTGVADVGDHGGPSDERGASVLRASEPGPGGGRLRRLRGGIVRGVLRGADGPPESTAGPVFPSCCSSAISKGCRPSGGSRGGWPIR